MLSIIHLYFIVKLNAEVQYELTLIVFNVIGSKAQQGIPKELM